MDITALYDREVAYYSGRSIVVWLPVTLEELPADVLVSKTNTGVKTTITAPYTPNTTQTIDQITVLNKPAGVPVRYSATFTTADTATLVPAPQFLVNQEVTIGSNTYRVIEITGSTVRFERAVSDLLVFVAQAVTDEVTYQWQILEGVTWSDIPGATLRTYEPIAGDVGKDLRVIVTYTDGRGEVGQSATVTPSDLIPNQVYNVSPVFPVIADMVLDVERSYTANSVNKFVIEVDTI